MSSVIGDKIKLSIFGESHGKAIGCVIDGLPAGVKLDFDKIYKDMARRAPGKDKFATPRLEKDIPIVLSGVIDDVTTGAPLAMIIENTNTKSGDYSNILDIPRPSHSDYTAYVKYNGFNDIRGGGHFSGRLTAPLVFAGSVAKQILAKKGIKIAAHIKQIGCIVDEKFDYCSIDNNLIEKLNNSRFAVIDDSKQELMEKEIEKYRLDLNSVGGIVECACVGIEAGIGGNMFDTVEGKLASILFGVPAVKGVEFGLGFGFANQNAYDVNDCYRINGNDVELKTNNNGGVLGGITNGAPIIVSTVIKPTPSIAKAQDSVNLQTMTNEKLVVNGRHDPCIVPRAVVVIECAVAFGLLDLMM